MTAKRVYRGCLNKRRYADQGTAALHAQYRVGRGAPPLRPYACNVCKGWHLTKRVPANAEVPGLGRNRSNDD